jgi:hypothetical protein
VATTIKSRGVRFLITRVITGAAAAGLFVSLWAGVAASAAHTNSATSGSTAAVTDQQPVVQDGWRWDPASQQWVAIAQATPEAVAPQPVIVIERQPIYYTTYVQQVPGGSYVQSSGSTTASMPNVPTDTGSSAPAPSAPAPAAPVAAAPVAPAAPPKPAAPPPAPKTTKAS